MPSVQVVDCPKYSVLRQFLSAELPDEHALLVDSHVARCASCQEILDGLVEQVGGVTEIERLLTSQADTLFPRPPKSIGGYRVLGELGRGSYGVVYRAHDDSLDRDVAIKRPHPSVVRAAGGLELYLQEARTLARLEHPRIVSVYEARADGAGSCYVVSQYIEGGSLEARLAEGPIPPREAVAIVAAIAEALQHAHDQGVVHRDVKPANILLDARRRPYLADFGLALRAEQMEDAPDALGTPAYMSPEQARGEGQRVDGRSDIYSLGVVFYKLLTGERPFAAPSVEELLLAIARDDAPPARNRNRVLPRELDRICAKALARDPSMRYQAAADMANDLAGWLRGKPTRLRRRRALLAGAAVSLAAAAMVGPWPAPPLASAGIKPWVGFAPLVVASELDLCGGVELALQPLRNTADARRRLVSGELDLAPMLVDSLVLARADRTPAQIVLQLDVSLTADAVVARRGIDSFDALRGGRVAFMHHEAPHFLLLSLCDRHGVAPGEFEPVKTETAQEAVARFVAGEVDAVVSYEPFLQDALAVAGARRLATAADDPGSVIDILVARERFLQERREWVERVIDGWFRALRLLQRGEPNAVESACRFLGAGGPPVSVGQFREMERGMRYGGPRENRAFFRADAGGRSAFHERFDVAQRRWDAHQQLSRRTDARRADGSAVFLARHGTSG